MHIVSCLNEKHIVNPYTHEWQVVPCGKCAACRNQRVSVWVQRLDQERYCWQYALFFTLTYSNDHLPIMRYNSDKHGYMDLSSEHYDIVHNNDFPYINTDEYLDKQSFDKEHYILAKKFLESTPNLPYVSVYDVQKFVKRIRIHIVRKLKSNEKIRYFICSEYGPKTFRPHYHGIFFFNSEQLAATLPQFIREDWQYGFVDTSFVSGTNSDYVASYVNCLAHMPSIYNCKFLRPFMLCSKNPPIGSLVHSTHEIRKIFDEASPLMPIQDHKSGLFENVPLWKNYKDSLFPKITAFGRFSDIDRVRLYRAFDQVSEKFPLREITFPLFKNYVTSDYALVLYKDYLAYAKSFNDDIENFLIRWYRISNRVCYQSASFGMSVKDYVGKIVEFYENCEKLRQKKQFEFEDQFAETYDSAPLVGLDTLYLQRMLDTDIGNLTYEEIVHLQSFGVDIGKLNSDDPSIRMEYICTLLPNMTTDYNVFKMDNEVIFNKKIKKKKKNEYILETRENDLLERLDKFQQEYDNIGKIYADF